MMHSEVKSFSTVTARSIAFSSEQAHKERRNANIQSQTKEEVKTKAICPDHGGSFQCGVAPEKPRGQSQQRR